VDARQVTFVVRLTEAAGGTWTAVVERVRTGEKHRVHDLGTIGDVIVRLVTGGSHRANVRDIPGRDDS
jgi:hypothetical protein